MLPSGDKAYFVPIRNLVEHLLRRPSFGRYFTSPLLPNNDGVLRDRTDGTRVTSHPVSCANNRSCIVMLLYSDDIELANALVMKRGLRGKLSVFYVTFVNIPVAQRSKQSNIFLVAVGKTQPKNPNSKECVAP